MFDLTIDHRTRHCPSRPAAAVVTTSALPRLLRPRQPAQITCLQQARQQQQFQQQFQQ